MTDEPKDGAIPSPFFKKAGAPMTPPPPALIMKHLEVKTVERQGTPFLTHMSMLALLAIAVGVGAVHNAYPYGSLADIASRIAFISFTVASAMAIMEHSQKADLKRASDELGDIIKKAFNHPS